MLWRACVHACRRGRNRGSSKLHAIQPATCIEDNTACMQEHMLDAAWDPLTCGASACSHAASGLQHARKPTHSCAHPPTHPPTNPPTCPPICRYEVLEFEPGKKLVLSGLSEHHTQVDRFIFMPDRHDANMTVRGAACLWQAAVDVSHWVAGLMLSCCMSDMQWVAQACTITSTAIGPSPKTTQMPAWADDSAHNPSLRKQQLVFNRPQLPHPGAGWKFRNTVCAHTRVADRPLHVQRSAAPVAIGAPAGCVK